MRPQFNKMFHVLYKGYMKFAVLNPNYDHFVIKYLMFMLTDTKKCPARHFLVIESHTGCLKALNI